MLPGEVLNFVIILRVGKAEIREIITAPIGQKQGGLVNVQLLELMLI